MRARTIVAVVAGVAGAAFWWHQWNVTAGLELEVRARQEQARELAALRAEEQRLRAAQPAAEEWARLQARATEQRGLERALAQATEEERRHRARPLQLGGWRPAQEWQARGDRTPLATVESTLAAAAGGDVAALLGLFELSPEAREAADALYGRLSPVGQANFGSAEAMLAALTVKRIPVGDAQVVWVAEHAEDETSVGLLLRNPAGASGATTFPAQEAGGKGPAERRPPQGRADAGSGMVFLSLRKSGERWRVIVPGSAVASLGRELGEGR